MRGFRRVLASPIPGGGAKTLVGLELLRRFGLLSTMVMPLRPGFLASAALASAIFFSAAFFFFSAMALASASALVSFLVAGFFVAGLGLELFAAGFFGDGFLDAGAFFDAGDLVVEVFFLVDADLATFLVDLLLVEAALDVGFFFVVFVVFVVVFFVADDFFTVAFLVGFFFEDLELDFVEVFLVVVFLFATVILCAECRSPRVSFGGAKKPNKTRNHRESRRWAKGRLAGVRSQCRWNQGLG
ncbi:MAG TPA: hypothetical protein ENJ00_02025 [Phycisphaerales bacterium]|nr:hypothetical protein [Phycisphaerales bacterium]